MTTLNLLELAAALTAAQDAINAQANSQPEIDRLKNELENKRDYITTLETDILKLKSENGELANTVNNNISEMGSLRRERDDHGLEAMALRDELDTLKANIDRALGAATETFYSTMQMKPQPIEVTSHIHVPIEDVKPAEMLPILADEPTSFNEPEPSYGDVLAWSSWNKRRVDWNNKVYNEGKCGLVVNSTCTSRDYSYDT